MVFKSKVKNKILNGQAREIVNTVVKFMRKEAGEAVKAGTPIPIIPFDRVQERASAATGVSMRTVQRICCEAKNVESGKKSCFVTLKRNGNRNKTQTDLDDFDKCALRRTILNYYLTDNKAPTIKRIHRKFCDDNGYTGSTESLRKEIISLGFSWRKTKNNRKILMEKHDIRYLRSVYLRGIKGYREQNRPIIFMDDAYLHSSKGSLKKPIRKGLGLIIVNAGSEDGFIPGAYVTWKSTGDYHNEINFSNYKKWIQEKLVPNLPPNSVVVIDNSPYHNKQSGRCPMWVSSKEDMLSWLQQKNVTYEKSMSKTDLYNLIKLHKPQQKTYEIDRLLNEHGHDVLRLPPYHPDLNPIELVWAALKQSVCEQNVTYNLNDLEALSDQFFSELAESEWKSQCQCSKKIEDDFIKNEPLIDKAIDDIIINLSEEPDSNTEEYFSDSSQGSGLSGTEEII